MSLDEKTDESAVAERSELFSSALYIIVIPVDNHVHLLQYFIKNKSWKSEMA
jgi:hypothetical protein